MAIEDASTRLVDALRKRFHYDPATGILSRHDGKACTGHTRKDGYVDLDLTVGPDRYRLKVHRVAWLLHHGSWPKHVVDHINGNPSDNRICNLRDVTHAFNSQNRAVGGLDDSDSSGSYEYRDAGWRSEIVLGERRVYLGVWESKAEARAAYITAKRLLHAGYLDR